MIRRRMTVKRVDPWSILKLGLVLNIAGAAILVVTGMVIWGVIRRLQIIERVCEQAQSLLGFESCVISGGAIMRSGLLLAGLFVVVLTGVMVFSAFLYNLIADLTGGVEVSMLDHSGQLRTAAGGVQVSPELTGQVGEGPIGRPPMATGGQRPVGAGAGAASSGALGAGAGAIGVAATQRVGGPAVATSGDPTMVSAAARPNTAVPLLDDHEVPPIGTVTGAVPTAGPVGESPGPVEPTGDQEWSPVADGGAEPDRVRGRAAAAGAMFRGAADKTGSALSDVAHRATTALTDMTSAEAAARAARAEARRQSLDDLAQPPVERDGPDRLERGRRVPGADGPDRGTDAGAGRPPRTDRTSTTGAPAQPSARDDSADRASAGPGALGPTSADSGPGGSTSTGRPRPATESARTPRGAPEPSSESGPTSRSKAAGEGGRRSGRTPGEAPVATPEEPASPQEAAAARVKARKESAPARPKRGADGKFVSAKYKAEADEPADLFGQHPRRGDTSPKGSDA